MEESLRAPRRLVIHEIHGRVLEHIKHEVESEGPVTHNTGLFRVRT